MGIIKSVISFIFFMSAITICAQTDVDTRIAVNDYKDKNTFVLIISNENYKYEQIVPYALNDGRVFRLYCEKTLGIPNKNIRFAQDATLNDIRMQLMWLHDVMNAYQGEARAIIYYSGHGMPSENGQHAYLLPVDGNSRLAGSGYNTEQLYKELGEMPSKGVLVLLDACFSGSRRDGEMLASNRGVAIKVKSKPIEGNLVVFSAAQGDETAYPYQEYKHGLFTFQLLSVLQAKGGFVTLGELSDEVIKKVTRTSIVENNKIQTPNVAFSSKSSGWRNWPFAAKPANKYEKISANFIHNNIEKEIDIKPVASSKNSGVFQKYIDAAENGDTKAQFMIAKCYHSGDGVAKDVSQAAYWWKCGADKGDPNCQYYLGLLYLNGEGVKRDISLGIELIKNAADKKIPEAQNKLGCCYRDGIGVSQNIKMAMLWWLKAALQGNDGAQVNLGFCYANGYGVDKDLKEAREWWEKAAIQGNETAKNNLKKLNEEEKELKKTQQLIMSNLEQTNNIVQQKNSIGYSFTINGVLFNMVYVEGGIFMMGATDEQGAGVSEAEKPAHPVELSNYYIGETEVTQELWIAIMGDNPSYEKGDKLPVTNVSWDDCCIFINRLNSLTELHFRLPTEAEWEYAARGGKKSKAFRYSGSNNANDVGWYIKNADNKTHEVKSKLPNELGLFDMTGNVTEWCNDWYDKNYYKVSPSKNPKGPETGSYRVLRGNYYRGTEDPRISLRDTSPFESSKVIGLRLSL